MDLQLILMIFALIAMLNMAIIANVLLILPILFPLYDYYVLINTVYLLLGLVPLSA